MSGRVVKTVPIQQVALTFANCKPLFFALGDGTRQEIIMTLAQTEELNVMQLTAKLPLSRPAISHHLKVLRQAGLVAVRRQGTGHYYSLTIDEAVKNLQRFTFEVEHCEP